MARAEIRPAQLSSDSTLIPVSVPRGSARPGPAAARWSGRCRRTERPAPQCSFPRPVPRLRSCAWTQRTAPSRRRGRVGAYPSISVLLYTLMRQGFLCPGPVSTGGGDRAASKRAAGKDSRVASPGRESVLQAAQRRVVSPPLSALIPWPARGRNRWKRKIVREHLDDLRPGVRYNGRDGGRRLSSWSGSACQPPGNEKWDLG